MLKVVQALLKMFFIGMYGSEPLTSIEIIHLAKGFL